MSLLTILSSIAGIAGMIVLSQLWLLLRVQAFLGHFGDERGRGGAVRAPVTPEPVMEQRLAA